MLYCEHYAVTPNNPISCGNSALSSDDNNNAGVIVGAVIGSLIVILLIVILGVQLTYITWKYRTRYYSSCAVDDALMFFTVEHP